jgi:hypothetical protein
VVEFLKHGLDVSDPGLKVGSAERKDGEFVHGTLLIRVTANQDIARLAEIKKIIPNCNPEGCNVFNVNGLRF